MNLETSRPSRPHYDDPQQIPPGLVTQRELLDAGLEAVHSAVATATLNGERELLYERARAIARVAPTHDPKAAMREARAARPENAPSASVASSAAFKRVSDLLDREDVLILDTETTGGGPRAEIIEVALIDTTGATRFESLVRPTSRIQPGAQRVHGLSRADLEFAPSWTELDEAFRELVRYKTVLAYNVSFDRGMVRQTRERYELRSSLEVLAALAWSAPRNSRGCWRARNHTGRWATCSSRWRCCGRRRSVKNRSERIHGSRASGIGVKALEFRLIQNSNR
jgi:Exonuclease